jgi:signal peptidase
VHAPSRLLPRRRLARLTGLPLTAALLVVWFILLRPLTLGGPAGYIIVAGHSMEPSFWTGDLAITQRQATYAIGDVVAFSTEGGQVIHRIVGGDAVTGYEVRGDNKERPDLWRPRPDSIVGKVWLQVPQVGTLLVFVRQPAILAGLAAAIAFFLAFTASPVRWPGRRPAPPSATAAAHAPAAMDPGP